jgi:hypothetical protein
MAAAVKNLLIEQGATFQWDLQFLDGEGMTAPLLDLSGKSFQMHVRSETSSPVVLVALSSALGGGITILPQVGADMGRISIRIEALATAALSFESAVYDLEMTEADGTVIRVYQGAVGLNLEVTR